MRQHYKSEHWAPCSNQTPSWYDWKIVESNVKPEFTHTHTHTLRGQTVGKTTAICPRSPLCFTVHRCNSRYFRLKNKNPALAWHCGDDAKVNTRHTFPATPQPSPGGVGGRGRGGREGGGAGCVVTIDKSNFVTGNNITISLLRKRKLVPSYYVPLFSIWPLHKLCPISVERFRCVYENFKVVLIKFPFKRKACPVLEVKLPSIVC